VACQSLRQRHAPAHLPHLRDEKSRTEKWSSKEVEKLALGGLYVMHNFMTKSTLNHEWGIPRLTMQKRQRPSKHLRQTKLTAV
jgi:hypothetical protein